MRDYASTSYWLETCGDDLTPRPALSGSADVDVAILGAGYSGLWTAYYLQARDPSLKIALVDKEIAGFGASGRNGSWCSCHFPTSLEALAKHHGRDSAVAMYRAMAGAVDEVGRVAAAEGLDIHFAKGGAMTVARGPQQLPSVQGAYAEYEQFGLADQVQLLDKIELEQRIRIAGTLGAVYYKNAATIHPGRLVRGLARLIERRGATIYEQTAVTDFTTGRASGAAYHARRSAGQNDRAVRRGLSHPIAQIAPAIDPGLFADDADGAALRRRLGGNRLAKDGECIELLPSHHRIHFQDRTTAAFSLAAAARPIISAPTSRTNTTSTTPTLDMLRDNVRRWFPRLKDVRFTHAWGGPLGFPRDFMPTMQYDPRAGVASARGYTGNGVSTTNLAGRVLAGSHHRHENRDHDVALRQPSLAELGAGAAALYGRALHAKRLLEDRSKVRAHGSAAERQDVGGAVDATLIAA